MPVRSHWLREAEIEGSRVLEVTAGEIYFIGETDVRSGTETEYRKIGLVKDNGKDRVSDRVGEHQTGNPRRLFLIQAVKTACVSTVENRLHRAHAAKQVSGEWFVLDHSLTDNAISMCRSLAREVEENLPQITLATELSSVVSNGVVGHSTDEARHWHTLYVRGRAGEKICDAIAKDVLDLLDRLQETGFDTSIYVERRVSKPSTRLDKKGATRGPSRDLGRVCL